jgi:hypothetical protein
MGWLPHPECGYEMGMALEMKETTGPEVVYFLDLVG